jgi:hypothetical protein
MEHEITSLLRLISVAFETAHAHTRLTGLGR